MLTKGAIGNLVNRYRAVLKKCNLINTFGSLAVASMLVLGGAGAACAADFVAGDTSIFENASGSYDNVDAAVSFQARQSGVKANAQNAALSLGGEGMTVSINLPSDYTASSCAIRAYTRNDFGPYSSTINVAGDKLDIVNNVAGGYGIFAGSAVDDTTKTAGGQIVIDSIETNVTADTALSTMSLGSLTINSKKLTVNGSEAAIRVRGNSSLTINSAKDADAVIVINGDIDFNVTATEDRDASVTINLTNAESSLNGNIITTTGSTEDTATSSDVTGMALSLSNGARWSADATSFVNTLSLDGGNVNVASGADIRADNVSGSGNINMEDAEDLGTFTAKAGAADLNVQATDAEGNVKNADQTDAETLKKLKAQVNAAEATVTASAAEGDVNGAITVAADGSVSTANNTLMDAALKQASVTTVALDKILTNDVRKRLGDIRSDKNASGVWMRWDGGKLQGGGLSNDFNTIQIGGDTKVGKNCRLGVAGSFTHGDAEFARGTAELEGFSFAAYATWMGENGMFADVVARLGSFSNEMSVEGNKGDMDNRVASLSGEYGWRFNVCDQFFVEPQVELAYTYVSSDDLQLGTAHYEFDSVDSLTGRAGLVAGWNLPNDRGNVYARASVLQQFMGDAKISGANGSARNVQKIDGDDTWLEYGIGANIKLTDKAYIWADVERTEGADIDEEWRGTVGIRYSF